MNKDRFPHRDGTKGQIEQMLLDSYEDLDQAILDRDAAREEAKKIARKRDEEMDRLRAKLKEAEREVEKVMMGCPSEWAYAKMRERAEKSEVEAKNYKSQLLFLVNTAEGYAYSDEEVRTEVKRTRTFLDKNKA